MKPDPAKLIEPTREDLLQAITHAMLFSGRKRSHHWDQTNARVAAEKLIDGLASANYVILRGQPGRSAAEAAGDLEAAVGALEKGYGRPAD